MLINKKNNLTIPEFIRARKVHIFLAFITQFFLLYQKILNDIVHTILL